MIGVVAEAAAAAVVEEFFELFKTPWEPFRPGRRYGAVIATTSDVPATDATLLLVFGSTPTDFDRVHGIAAGDVVVQPMLDANGLALPCYGDVLLLQSPIGTPCVGTPKGIAGVASRIGERRVLRLGYDLFDEVRHLLLTGQPADRAPTPALDVHITLIREWLVDAGVGFVEIPPVPAGHPFAVCLTHDIDFFGIRRHKLDHTMWGFLYRATAGALRNRVRGRMGWRRLGASLKAAASLPLVYLGLARDFWLPFEWYQRAERSLAATYYIIPFKGRPGDKVPGERARRRACAYDAGELADWIATLRRNGDEVGVHGIDAWHSVGRGVAERNRIQSMTGDASVGIRMHWLLSDDDTGRVLERAGFAYDSTAGYNDTVGYRNGTGQVFRPPGCRTLLELPLHIQDGAMFLSNRLDLSEEDAWQRCERFMLDATERGGVLTILWHDRSHAAERFWGDFYLRLLAALAARGAWFGTAGQVVDWFRRRRQVTFGRSPADAGWEHVEACSAAPIEPPLLVRIHPPRSASEAGSTARRFVDHPWRGDERLELGSLAGGAPTASGARLAVH